MDGQVCKKCNNNLGHLDQALTDEFDIVAYMADVRRKKGKSPAIFNRGNLVGKYTEKGKTIFINMENCPVKSLDGSSIGGYGKSKRNIKAKLKIEKPFAEISFDVTFGANQKFVRGIYKVAFSSFAYFLGREIALREEYDPIREYVMHGKGKRKILILKCSDESYRNQVWAPYSAENEAYVIVLRLAFVEIVVDLTPNQSFFPRIFEEAKKMYGTTDWSFLPIEP
jgi:hypothetical protein